MGGWRERTEWLRGAGGGGDGAMAGAGGGRVQRHPDEVHVHMLSPRGRPVGHTLPRNQDGLLFHRHPGRLQAVAAGGAMQEGRGQHRLGLQPRGLRGSKVPLHVRAPPPPPPPRAHTHTPRPYTARAGKGQKVPLTRTCTPHTHTPHVHTHRVRLCVCLGARWRAFREGRACGGTFGEG